MRAGCTPARRRSGLPSLEVEARLGGWLVLDTVLRSLESLIGEPAGRLGVTGHRAGAGGAELAAGLGRQARRPGGRGSGGVTDHTEREE